MACDLVATELAGCLSEIKKIESQTRLLRLIAELSCEIAAAGGGGGGTPGGAPGDLQFNDSGAFGGFGDYNSGTSALTLPGTVTAPTFIGALTGNVTGSSSLNVLKAGDTMTGLLTIAQATANTGNLVMSGYSLTGADATGMVAATGTWNTTGNPVLLRYAITNTASGATTRFLEFLAGAAGATSVFQVTKAGTIFMNGILAFVTGSGAASLGNVVAGDGLRFTTGFTARWDLIATGHFTAFVDNAYDIGTSGAFRPRNLFLAGGITHGSATLLTTTTALTNGAAASGGTLLNAPAAGDPTKWCPVNDNGTTRYIPMW